MPNSYEEMLREVLMEGSSRPDRTGTGTTSLFGGRIEYDLRNGFPLITSKRVPFRIVAEELLWFLRGETNIKPLQEKNVHIWDEWAREDGALGPVYGEQYRRARSYFEVVPVIHEKPASPLPELEPLIREGRVRDLNARKTYGVGYMGDYDASDEHYESLVEVWRQMIRRCYDESCNAYSGYGGRGVHVEESWHCFANFQRDAKRLPGWAMRVEHPGDYTIDKDAKLASNRYDATSCIWASRVVQHANKSNTQPFTAVSPEGETCTFYSIGSMARSEGMNVSAIHRCLEGTMNKTHGWTNFQRILTHDPQAVLRYIESDQLAEVIASIKQDPTSRRHLVSLWDTPSSSVSQLPPCHGSVIQFYVEEDDVLSIQIYQRSADFFLGVPINIASYALLTKMVAHVTGYGVGRLIWTGGDCHIYDNHRDQVKEQLSRDYVPLPDLDIVGDVDNIDDFTIDNFKVTGYNPHPTLKGVVAV